MTTILPAAQIEELIGIKESVRKHAIDLGSLAIQAAPRSETLEIQCLQVSGLMNTARVKLDAAILQAAAEYRPTNER